MAAVLGEDGGSRTPCGVCELKFKIAPAAGGGEGRTPCGVCELKFLLDAVDVRFRIVAPRVGCVS